jgi:hypothetical protein
MSKVIITRKQFERIREIFEMYDTVDRIVLKESNESGIGPTTVVEFDPKSTVRVDITDLTSW